MTLELWLSFVAASLLIVASPGPAVALLVTTGVTQGRRAALSLLPGYLLGDLAAMTLSFAGVGALLMASAELFGVLKWLGAAYLVYLGIRMWREAGQLGGLEDTAPVKLGMNTLKAFLVTMLNPKSLLFFLAFMPQFITPAQPALPQLVILGTTFLGVGLLSDLGYTLLSSSSGHLLTARFRRILHRGGGASLVGAGVAMAAMRRP
ncbi:homoserine/homoserine lactone efflux protein [Halomonas elongata]|uniref:Homoserine/homoserine lactone efflux protein n=1 Tax=Halomonas elongata TaxID=2746 RepID=A0A1B8P550_HALEL|nr:LysE family translocator [Halomonas elongata]OBX37386.1 homoserine/homoserine lactone efflux protein [Halomonas elongata]